jgi:YbbR domain-containing protein
MNNFFEQLTNFFKTNYKEKFLALIITIVVWIFVVSINKKIKTFDIPLYVAINKKSVFVTSPPKFIRVKTKGNAFNFAMIDKNNLRLKLSLPNKKVGQFKLFLDNSNFSFLSSVKILSISPNEIKIKTAIKEEKIVSIEPYLDGQPKEGFKIESVEIVPKKIKVVGPRDFLDNLDSINTEKINLTGKDKSFSKKLAIFTGNSAIKIKNNIKTANVTIKIDKDVRKMFFKKIALVVEGNIDAVIKPAYINVILKGPIEKLEHLREIGFTVFVKNKHKKRYYVNKFYFKDLPEDVYPVKFTNIKSILVNKSTK